MLDIYATDLDSAYVLLTLFGARFAPTVIPQIVRQLTGLSADSPKFQAAYAEQLRRVVETAGRIARLGARSSTVVHRTVPGEHVETEVRGGIAPH